LLKYLALICLWGRTKAKFATRATLPVPRKVLQPQVACKPLLLIANGEMSAKHKSGFSPSLLERKKLDLGYGLCRRAAARPMVFFKLRELLRRGFFLKN